MFFVDICLSLWCGILCLTVINRIAMKRFFALLCVVAVVAVDVLAQVAPGIYGQTYYRKEGCEWEPYPFYQYRVVNGEGRVLKMQYLELKPLMFQIERVSVTMEDVAPGSFCLEWTCDMSNHKTIPYGTKVRERYESRYPDCKRDKKWFKLVAGANAIRAKNKLEGVWRLMRDGVEYYKVVSGKVRIVFFVYRYSDGTLLAMRGDMDSFSYRKDGNSLEGGNFCRISWLTPESFRLSYDGGIEDWEKSSLPDEVVDWFRY